MRIWLVDDDAFFRRTTGEALEALGCTLEVFEDAASCVVALSNAKRWPEVVLVDACMPVVDGLRLTAMIRALPGGERPAVWVVSGVPGVEKNVHLEAGADGFSPKPLDALALVGALGAHLARRGDPLQGLSRVAAAVLFADLRGFTAFSAQHDPETVVEVLSGLTEGFVTAVEEAGGWIDKILGDGVIALFGVPRPHPEGVLAAALAAAAYQRATTLFLGDSVLLAGRAELTGAGCGLTFGEVVAGRMGPPGREIYTAIGDPMNLCARIQGVARAGETLLDPAAVKALAQRLPLGPERVVPIKGFGPVSLRPLVQASGERP